MKRSSNKSFGQRPCANKRLHVNVRRLQLCLAVSMFGWMVLSLAVIHTKTRLEQNRQAREIQPAPIDQIVGFLLTLARKPTNELRKALYEDDIFHLKALDKECPFSRGGIIPWLPQVSNKTALSFQKKEDGVILWYEHLSKAGGTSFCKLAQTNMPRKEVPTYYCMPSDDILNIKQDGRVGLWSNEKLATYLQKSTHRLVSNEWQPFPPERLQKGYREKLLLVTTIREPLNRLLSAYRFWGITHNSRKVKPELPEWLWRQHIWSREKSPRDMGVALHVARYNFITWTFSNGTMPLAPQSENKDVPQPGLSVSDESSWRLPFETAVRVLSEFDIVLVTEEMSVHPEPIRKLLGWTNLDEVQVVPSGKVMNSDAESSLPKEHYDILWDANRFDLILYHWLRAVYLTRIQCPLVS